MKMARVHENRRNGKIEPKETVLQRISRKLFIIKYLTKVIPLGL